MKKLISTWLDRSRATSQSSMLVEASYEELARVNDDRYPLKPLWKELVAAMTELDDHVVLYKRLLVIPSDACERWIADPAPIARLIDLKEELSVMTIIREGGDPQVAVTGSQKTLRRLRDLLPGRTKRAVILFGMSVEELTEALASL